MINISMDKIHRGDIMNDISDSLLATLNIHEESVHCNEHCITDEKFMKMKDSIWNIIKSYFKEQVHS
ncbi:hypothetical protein LCGC14_0195850 [marine sediment metagenome]|uniref:Uncharacterized protein n=1 Tax=marine sediment metagenome TaxID=412755 RepID=A0A0F9V202_9ZZZZ